MSCRRVEGPAVENNFVPLDSRYGAYNNEVRRDAWERGRATGGESISIMFLCIIHCQQDEYNMLS